MTLRGIAETTLHDGTRHFCYFGACEKVDNQVQKIGSDLV
jgi:hypothetical protein